MVENRSVVSDEILMAFMKEVKKDVSLIKDSVGQLANKQVETETKLNSYIDNEIKKAVLITIIMFLIGLIGGLLGYIWGTKQKEDDKLREKTKSGISGSVKRSHKEGQEQHVSNEWYY